MTDPSNERSRDRDSEATTREDASFIEQVAANYTPAPLSDDRRSRFDRSLSARIHPPRRPWRSFATLAAAAAAVAIAVAAVPTLFVENGEGDFRASGAEAVAAAEWESQLFDANALLDADEFDDADLPDDYAAIAGLLLDG